MRKEVAVDFRKERATRVNAARLQRLPLLLFGVIGHVRHDAMGMKLRIEAAAGIVPVTGHDEIARDPVFVFAVGPDTGCGLALDFGWSCLDRPVVRFDETGPLATRSRVRMASSIC